MKTGAVPFDSGRALHQAGECLQLAWRNLNQHRLRTFTALGGVVFAVFLIFIQLGFLDAVRRESTLLFNFFNFDLAVVSNDYQLLYDPPSFDRIRLIQAQALPEVVDSASVNVAIGRWTDPATRMRSSMLLVGVDSESPQFVRNPAIRSALGKLAYSHGALLDAYSHPDYGPRTVGAKGEIGGQEVNVVGLYRLGLFFYSEGSALVDNGDFTRLTGRPSRLVSLGLLRLAPGVDATVVRDHLNVLLPPDVRVFTREQFIQREQRYFVAIKPLGMIFRSGVLIALFVGGVILFQVLSTEIGNRMRELATLKAIGFGNSFVYGVGGAQTLLFALAGFIPAALLAMGLFAVVRSLSHLPVRLDLSLAATVFVLVIVMCVGAALAALQRVRQADPAGLF